MSSEEFGPGDLIRRLGITFVQEEGSAVSEPVTTGEMVVWHAAPAVISTANDLDRVAAETTMSTPEEARRRRINVKAEAQRQREHWRNRRVMVPDAHGEPTNIPLIISVTFVPRKRFTEGYEDMAPIARQVVEGYEQYGEIEIVPLLNVGIEFLKRLPDNTVVSGGAFHGVLYAPKRKGPYKFLPLGLADLELVQRWQNMVDQARRTKSFHKDWPRIEPIVRGVGRQGTQLMFHAPRYLKIRELDRTTICMIDTYFDKQVVLHPSSQTPRLVCKESDVDRISKEAAKKGKQFYPFGECVFTITERENRIDAVYMGLRSEVDLSASTKVDLSGITFNVNPFDVLDQKLERYDPEEAERFVRRCLSKPFDSKNPLFMRAIREQLILPGMNPDAIRAQLGPFTKDALKRAERLWYDAIDSTLSKMRRYARPTIEELLSGNRLDVTIETLNPNDVASAWIAKHIGEYNHANRFHVALRERLLYQVAEKAGYTDPVKVQTTEPDAGGIGNQVESTSGTSTTTPNNETT